mmetsp:Transcript_14919/g.23763  ORF Transcript_14919/g.23763 Transcript_14919/m.23763 type:complete len:255 (+) Transcript_14919:156-920(+)
MAKTEARSLKKKAIATFDNMLRYMNVKSHVYPTTTGLAVVTTGHAEPSLRDEIFCQLIKQTTQTPKVEWQLLGFRLIYLCLSAFMPEKASQQLLAHIALYANPDFEEKLPEPATTVEAVASHCLRLFIANRQMQEEMALVKDAGEEGKGLASSAGSQPYIRRDRSPSPLPPVKEGRSYNSETATSEAAPGSYGRSGGGRSRSRTSERLRGNTFGNKGALYRRGSGLYVTLEFVKNITKGQMTQQDDFEEEEPED